MTGTPVPFIFTLCLTLQLVSATFLVRDFSSPNAATVIATAIVERGEFAVRAWPRTARTPTGIEEPLRAYHLPAEPLLLAAGFRLAPQALTPYLHVPITALFVTSIAAAAFWTGGRRLGLTAGILASFDPFILLHGPVWDDAFLAAALEWTVFAALLKSYSDRDSPGRRAVPTIVNVGLIAAATGLAALTRTSSQAVLGLVALGLVAHPWFRSLRASGWAMFLGLTVALAAWGARNYAVLGEFHTGSSHDGITLFESNYATARPSLLRTGVVERYTLEDLAPHFAAVSAMTELDADRYFTRQAFGYLRDQPRDVLATAGLKLIVSVTGVHLGQPLTTPRNLVAVGSNIALLVAGILGWHWWMRDQERPDVRLLAFLGIVVTTVTCLGLVAGPVGLRYRISAAPLLYMAAAAGIMQIRRRRR